MRGEKTEEKSNDAPPVVFCSSEKKLLESIASYINKADPDLIIGWHVIGFDLAFINTRARLFGGTDVHRTRPQTA